MRTWAIAILTTTRSASEVRVVIFTPGSRGGVQPYLAPGGLLKAANHNVNVATHSTFEAKVRERNLGLSLLSDDPRTVMVETGKNPVVCAGRFVEL
jgi:sterol 3beta-glucosyltransferase